MLLDKKLPFVLSTDCPMVRLRQRIKIISYRLKEKDVTHILLINTISIKTWISHYSYQPECRDRFFLSCGFIFNIQIIYGLRDLKEFSQAIAISLKRFSLINGLLYFDRFMIKIVMAD